MTEKNQNLEIQEEKISAEKKDSKKWLIALGIIAFCFVVGIGSFFLGYKLAQRKVSESARVTPTPTLTLELISPTPTLTPTVVLTPTLISTPTPTLTPTLTPTPTPTPKTFNWITYTNQKYNYRFKYDPSWFFNNQPSPEEKDDRIILQGDVAEKGWPDIGINLQYFDPQPQTIEQLKGEIESTFGDGGTIEITAFGKNNISAVLYFSPASPQAYATKNYYFIHNNKIFVIGFNDVGHPESDQIYQNFLNEFELL